jgi:tetratricopeptide (TPR) repeat protein
MPVIMRVTLLLVFALARPVDARLQSTRTDLPQLEMGNFLPAIRQQLERAYAGAQAHPTDPEANGTLGMILDAYAQYDAAAICYQRAQRLDSRSFRWLFYLGWVQAAQGRHDQAAMTLGNALRIQPGYVPAQLKLAESLFAIGRWDESRDIYQAVRTAHPESAEARYGLGRVSAMQ